MHIRGRRQKPACGAENAWPELVFVRPFPRAHGGHQTWPRLIRLIVAATCIAPPFGPAAFADPAPRGETEIGRHDAWAFKLTPSYYVTERQKDATDLNLRANLGAHAL